MGNCHTIYVTNLHDSGCGSLREALHEASKSCSKIEVLVNGTINLESALPEITAPLRFEGNGITLKNYGLNITKTAYGSTIDAVNITNVDNPNEKPPMVVSADNVRISNSTISNAATAAIYSKNTCGLTVTNCVLENSDFGIYLDTCKNVTIGGTESGGNNPTGNKGTTTPTFVRPPLGNIIGKNKQNGLYATNCLNVTLSGNFIGVESTGNANAGNGQSGVLVQNCNDFSFVGCGVLDEPFVYYNVISGNGGHGIEVLDSVNTIIQGNFCGITADNAHVMPNFGSGIYIGGVSRNTTIGGVIPLGNVTSGNLQHGTEIADLAANTMNWNTFAGLFAFGLEAPNLLDGILIRSFGHDNTIQTCVCSGNLGNGIHLADSSHSSVISNVLCGTTTNGLNPLPNGENGLKISGKSVNNSVSSDAPSVIIQSSFSGNNGYGILVTDFAAINSFYSCFVGLGILGDSAIPNKLGGILLEKHANNNTFGSAKGPFKSTTNYISGNDNFGLKIADESFHNSVYNNHMGLSFVESVIFNGGSSNNNILNESTGQNDIGTSFILPGATNASLNPPEISSVIKSGDLYTVIGQNLISPFDVFLNKNNVTSTSTITVISDSQFDITFSTVPPSGTSLYVVTHTGTSNSSTVP